MHLWCVPRITLLCEDRLKNHGIYGAFTTIQELPIHMYRLESDLATLEVPSCYPVSYYGICRIGRQKKNFHKTRNFFFLTFEGA